MLAQKSISRSVKGFCALVYLDLHVASVENKVACRECPSLFLFYNLFVSAGCSRVNDLINVCMEIALFTLIWLTFLRSTNKLGI